MHVPSEIFREYDIRGVVGRDLNAPLARALGQAVGSTLREGGGRRLVIGRDHRPSGEELAGALCEGALHSGCDVVDIGVTPTPVGYWAIQHLGFDGGVQVTGSHNPPEYNGFKTSLLGHSLYGAGITALRQRMLEGRFTSGAGRRESRALLDAYVGDLARLLGQPARPLKVVIDAGNGTGGLSALPLYRRLGHDVVPLYCEPDGSFPNHHPDPTVEANLADLQRAVAAHHADVGLAFDGDADRLGVVDRGGEIIWGDRLMVLFARDVLVAVPGASILGEVKCSQTMYDAIRAEGGVPVMGRTGHSLIKEKMKETGAPLAGEMSGHIFFAHRFYGFDDGVYAGGRLLEILARGQGSLTERLSDLPKVVSTPELRRPCAEARKFEVVAKVTEIMRARAERDGARVIDIDGVRVEWADGWGLVRASNTQAILVLRFEARSEQRLREIEALFDAALRSAEGEVA